MSGLYYWGDQGQFGPFSEGNDGYPHSGEVVRHYRVVVNRISATRFGKLYGQALGENPKTRIWVLQMERTNAVPLDITRRRIIAQILSIPPVLLGLSDGLAKVPLAMMDTPQMATRLSKQTTLQKHVLDEYQQSLVQYFAGYYHRHGQAALDDVGFATQELATLLSYAREQNRITGTTLISRYHQFAVNIAREQRNYDLALAHAQKAIKRAEEVHLSNPNSDLMTIALLRRGLAGFEQHITSSGQESLSSIVPYVDAAISHAEHAIPLMNGFASLEWGLVHAYTVRSETEKTQVMHRLDQGYKYVSHYRVEDDENFLKFSPGWYHLTRAEALIALKMYVDALGDLELAEEATPVTLPRRFAYIDALRAKAYIGLREYPMALSFAEDALKGSQAVKSEFNIARIIQIVQQLEESSYGGAGDVMQLGRKLKKSHGQLFVPTIS
jgi:tetratricopeptide (TPR) repeat protein